MAVGRTGQGSRLMVRTARRPSSPFDNNCTLCHDRVSGGAASSPSSGDDCHPPPRAGLLTPPPAATTISSAAAGPWRGCCACCPVGPRHVPRNGRGRGWAASSSSSGDNCFLRRGRAAAGTLRASSSFTARLGLRHRRRAAGVRGRPQLGSSHNGGRGRVRAAGSWSARPAGRLRVSLAKLACPSAMVSRSQAVAHVQDPPDHQPGWTASVRRCTAFSSACDLPAAIGPAATSCRLSSWSARPRWRLGLLLLMSWTCSSYHQPGPTAPAR
jgi:hypothetical protein